MLYFQRAIIAIAICWFVTPCYSVARVAVVSVSMAEPEGDRAAPFALEVDVLGSMLLTVGYTSSDHGC